MLKIHKQHYLRGLHIFIYNLIWLIWQTRQGIISYNLTNLLNNIFFTETWSEYISKQFELGEYFSEDPVAMSLMT